MVILLGDDDVNRVDDKDGAGDDDRDDDNHDDHNDNDDAMVMAMVVGILRTMQLILVC